MDGTAQREFDNTPAELAPGYTPRSAHFDRNVRPAPPTGTPHQAPPSDPVRYITQHPRTTEYDLAAARIHGSRCANLFGEVVYLALQDSFHLTSDRPDAVVLARSSRAFLELRLSMDPFLALGIDLQSWREETVPLLQRAWRWTDDDRSRARQFVKTSSTNPKKSGHYASAVSAILEHVRAHSELGVAP